MRNAVCPLCIALSVSLAGVLLGGARWSGTGLLFALTMWVLVLRLTWAPRPFWRRWL